MVAHVLLAILMAAMAVAPEPAGAMSALVEELVDVGSGLVVTSAFFAYPTAGIGTYLYVDAVNNSAAAIAPQS